DHESFDPILEDYAFFEHHSTEAEQDLNVYVQYLRTLPAEQDEIHLLDFGTGTGKFAAMYLAQAKWKKTSLKLTIIEPGDEARNAALKSLQAFTEAPIQHKASLPTESVNQYDLIIANHVLYYVPDLTETVDQLLGMLRPSGWFLTSFAGDENLLIQFW